MKQLVFACGAALMILISGCGGGSGGDDPKAGPTPVVSIPDTTTQFPQRKDLFYGYFGALGNQVQETSSHTNTQMELWFDSVEEGLARIRSNNQDLIVGLVWQVYDYSSLSIRPDAEVQIRVILDSLKSINALGRVVALYPIDEPDLKGFDADVLTQGNALVRRVANTYPELGDVQLLVVYGPPNTSPERCGCQPVPHFPGIASYDWVGSSEYTKPIKETVDILSPLLRADQHIVLIPDGTNLNRNDPKPYLALANSDTTVIGIIAFTWFDNGDPQRGVIQGIRSDGLASQYIAVGNQIVH